MPHFFFCLRAFLTLGPVLGLFFVLNGPGNALAQGTPPFDFTPSNPNLIRWTAAHDADGSVNHVLQVLSQKLGRTYSLDDFILAEERDLAFTHYKRLTQKVDGVALSGKNIRIWTARGSDRAVQVEALLEKDSAQPGSTIAGFGGSAHARLLAVRRLTQRLTPEQTTALARGSVLADLDDPNVRGISWTDQWVETGNSGRQLVRIVKVKAKRGEHFVTINLRTGRVLSREYIEFPQGEHTHRRHRFVVNNEHAQTLPEIPIQVFQIYEETPSGQVLPRVTSTLKNILAQVPDTQGDIYAPLKTQRYFDSKIDPVLGETAEGRAAGYWSPRYVREAATQIRTNLPNRANDFSSGLLLTGLYASINIHPDAIKAWAPLSFEPRASAPFFPQWVESTVDGELQDEMIPSNAYSGYPLYSESDAWNRPARRLPDHNPREYLNDGFDELQVYHGIDTLFDVLHARGFTDPELSTRPFNAFLFNPDLAMKDNAYYTDDTINFTTYNAGSDNAARNNSTVWHELGHGIMDRLMGDESQLADTGGLSEGMADFIAQIVVQALTDGVPFPGSDQFRINNRLGFFLTNEVHDDGEAYGGAMNDFMMAVVQKNGRAGVAQVSDVILEALRLTRDYPGLTAADWFNHILFADSLGRPGVREPYELSPFLLQALSLRNFKLESGGNEGSIASFSLINAASGEEVIARKPGSRQSPILVPLGTDEVASFSLKVAVKNPAGNAASASDPGAFAFKFPVRVRVQFRDGPIQGAIHWVGEEQGTKEYVLNSEADVVQIPLQVSGTCDYANRDDGACVDFAYIQLWNTDQTDQPVAKKRFYLRVKN